MKSCFGSLLMMLILVAVIGSALAIWHLSETAEFSRKSEAETPVVEP